MAVTLVDWTIVLVELVSCGTLPLPLPLSYFSFELHYEMLPISYTLAICGCDMNGLDICGAACKTGAGCN